MDVPATTVAMRASQADGRIELVTGDLNREDGRLYFYRWDGSLSRSPQIDETTIPNMRRVFPRAVIDGHLAVWGDRKTESGGADAHGFSLVEIHENFSVEITFSRAYEDLRNIRGSITTVQGNDDHSRFVVGMGHYPRCFEFFVADPQASDELYAALGTHEVTWPQAASASDITSLALCDHDQNGVDDCLFLGLGLMDDGLRPAMVTADTRRGEGTSVPPLANWCALSPFWPPIADR